MKRGQVFVRAQSPSGRWYSADVLDLEQPSFNAFVMDRLWMNGLVVGLADHAVPEEFHVTYRSTKEPESDGADTGDAGSIGGPNLRDTGEEAPWGGDDDE